MDLFACAVEVGAATESLVVPRRSALGVGSFVDWGQIDAFASLLVGTATDVGVFIVCKGGGLRSTGQRLGCTDLLCCRLRVSADVCERVPAMSSSQLIRTFVVPLVAVPASVRLVASLTAPTPECSPPRSEEVGRCAPWCGAGWRVAFLFRDGSGGAVAAWDLHSERQWLPGE